MAWHSRAQQHKAGQGNDGKENEGQGRRTGTTGHLEFDRVDVGVAALQHHQLHEETTRKDDTGMKDWATDRANEGIARADDRKRKHSRHA